MVYDLMLLVLAVVCALTIGTELLRIALRVSAANVTTTSRRILGIQILKAFRLGTRKI